MQTQLNAIWSDHSNRSCSKKVPMATDELNYLMDLNASISQAMAKTLKFLVTSDLC